MWMAPLFCNEIWQCCLPSRREKFKELRKDSDKNQDVEERTWAFFGKTIYCTFEIQAVSLVCDIYKHEETVLYKLDPEQRIKEFSEKKVQNVFVVILY